MFRPLSPVTPGGQLSADDLNRLFGEVETASKISAVPPLEVYKDATGWHIRLNSREGRWATVTALLPTDASLSGASGESCLPGYTCTLQTEGEDDGCTVDSTAENTITAYEVNGRTDVPTDGTWTLRVFPVEGRSYCLFEFPGTVGGFAYITGPRFCPSADWELPCNDSLSGGSGASGSGSSVCPAEWTYSPSVDLCCPPGHSHIVFQGGAYYCCPLESFDGTNCVGGTPRGGSNPCGGGGGLYGGSNPSASGTTVDFGFPCCPADMYPAVLVRHVPSLACPVQPYRRVWLQDVNGRLIPPGELVSVTELHPSVDVDGETRPLYGTRDGVGDRCQGCNADGHLCDSGGDGGGHDCGCTAAWSTRCGRCVPLHFDPSHTVCPSPSHPDPCGGCVTCGTGLEYLGAPCFGCFYPCGLGSVRNLLTCGCDSICLDSSDDYSCPEGQCLIYVGPGGGTGTCWECQDCAPCPEGQVWNALEQMCDTDPLGGP
jgi:hypothetical protein